MRGIRPYFFHSKNVLPDSNNFWTMKQICIIRSITKFDCSIYIILSLFYAITNTILIPSISVIYFIMLDVLFL